MAKAFSRRLVIPWMLWPQPVCGLVSGWPCGVADGQCMKPISGPAQKRAHSAGGWHLKRAILLAEAFQNSSRSHGSARRIPHFCLFLQPPAPSQCEALVGAGMRTAVPPSRSAPQGVTTTKYTTPIHRVLFSCLDGTPARNKFKECRRGIVLYNTRGSNMTLWVERDATHDHVLSRKSTRCHRPTVQVTSPRKKGKKIPVTQTDAGPLSVRWAGSPNNPAGATVWRDLAWASSTHLPPADGPLARAMQPNAWCGNLPSSFSDASPASWWDPGSCDVHDPRRQSARPLVVAKELLP